jgi:pimeloyl-ACP methyl ester carboxylesterase
MPTRVTAVVLALICGACAPAPRAVISASPPAPATWADPSPHRARFVTVAEGVQLEVLDWGGEGPPLIFLAGLGCSAHIFDEFAPAFRDRFHVYGVTRRGFGASSQPQAGYDIPTLGADLVAVLRALGLERASFVGHSIAGEELTWLAAHAPERVEKLVYLDAAYDRVAGREAQKDAPKAPMEQDSSPTEQDKASIAAYGAFVERAYGFRAPEAELRATAIFDASGKYVRDRTPDEIGDTIVKGSLHPDYAHVTAPALAIYRVAESAEKWASAAFWSSLNEADREKVRALFAHFTAMSQRERERFRREVAHGQVVEIRGASHYVFLSHRAVVLEAMRAFLGS